MALKKGMFESYVKEREAPSVVPTKISEGSKYSHNRVFDEPESLKKALANQDISSSSDNKKDIEVSLSPSLVEVANKHQQDFRETGAKHDLNWRPAGKEEPSKPNTNSTQTSHKVDTNLTQELNTNLTQTPHSESVENTYQTQTQHKPNTKPNTRKTQSAHKVDTNLTQTQHITTLIGVQRMILLFIFEECKKARSHITEPLPISYIANGLEIALGSVKTSIARLCEKNFLIINNFKNGRGGWSQYEIPDNVYKELLQMETQHKLHANYTQSRHKLDTKPNTQPDTNASSSSSFLNIKETTTTELSDEWNFDITPYTKFGFMTSQLKQLAPLGVISAMDVEQSLIEFYFDLENNSLPSIKGGKVGFLMGLFRKGVKYTSEAYLNEQEAAISEMAKRAEGKRKKLLEEKFVAWEAGLNDEERKEIARKLPTQLMVLHHAHGLSNLEVRKWLFDYFLLQKISE